MTSDLDRGLRERDPEECFFGGNEDVPLREKGFVLVATLLDSGIRSLSLRSFEPGLLFHDLGSSTNVKGKDLVR